MSPFYYGWMCLRTPWYLYCIKLVMQVCLGICSISPRLAYLIDSSLRANPNVINFLLCAFCPPSLSLFLSLSLPSPFLPPLSVFFLLPLYSLPLPLRPSSSSPCRTVMNGRGSFPKGPHEGSSLSDHCKWWLDSLSQSATPMPAALSQIDPESVADNSMRAAKDWLHQLPYFLTPTPLQYWNKPSQPEKLHAIAGLDGLRGWACLLVFNFHFLFTYTHKPMIGWGFGDDNWGIHQLPIIHMLISGHVMVSIFFVISGYVLSYKPLRLVRAYNFDEAMRTLASSTFRRGFRLYTPSVVGLFIILIAIRLGCFNYSTMVRNEGYTILGTNEQHPPIFPSLYIQLIDWFRTIVHLMDPWNWNLYYNSYNPHLWTIPVEFRSSMFVFLTILLTAKLRVVVRIPLVWCIIIFCMRWARWDVVLFLSGMCMAEFDLIYKLWEPAPPSEVGTSSEGHLNDLEKNEPATPTSPRRPLWIWLFVLGLFIGSSPNSAPTHTPGFRFLASLAPKSYGETHRFPQTIGAILIVFSINHSKDLQKLFTNRLAQYLGKISYAFYIVHGPILHSLGYSLMPNIWKITGSETDGQYCFGFLIGWTICLAVSLWAGDVFWRAVDIPSVRLARKIEDRLKAQGV